MYDCSKEMSHIQENLSYQNFNMLFSNPTVQLQRLAFWDVACIPIHLSRQQTTKALISLCHCTGWSVPLLFACNNNYCHRGFFCGMAEYWNNRNSEKSLNLKPTKRYCLLAVGLGKTCSTTETRILNILLVNNKIVLTGLCVGASWYLCHWY